MRSSIRSRPTQLVKSHDVMTARTRDETISLETWRANFGKDSLSVKSAVQWTPGIDLDASIRFECNSTTSARSIDLNGQYVDARGKSYLATITLPPFTSLVLFRSTSK